MLNDNDLRSIKEMVSRQYSDGRTWYSPITKENILALIVRLEAAEEVCRRTQGMSLEVLKKAYESWRKAAGK
jgi:hypothetical protein